MKTDYPLIGLTIALFILVCVAFADATGPAPHLIDTINNLLKG